jgi:hypothetical protein
MRRRAWLGFATQPPDASMKLEVASRLSEALGAHRDDGQTS